MFAKYVANMRAMLFCYFVLWLWDIWPPWTGMHDRHWSGDLFRCLHNSIILFHLHISTSALNSLFFAINYLHLWDKNQEWNSEIVEFFLLSLGDSCWALIWWISENPEPESKNYFQTKRKKSVCFQLHSVRKIGVSEYILAFGNTAELAEWGSRACC